MLWWKTEMTRLLSLAAGVLPEFGPEDIVAAAVGAGWPAVGITVEPETWTTATARTVRDRAADAGLTVLDVEVVWLEPGDDDPDHFRIIDAGAMIGAKNVLVVSSDKPGPTVEKLIRLIDHAAARSMRISLEFAAFTAVRNLPAALDIIAATGRTEIGLLIDPLHFIRTGGKPSELRAVDPGRFAYAQFCDANLAGPPLDDRDAIVDEALDFRLDIGAGGLPLGAILGAMPTAIPLSIELRSKAIREAWPLPVDRARAVLASTRKGLAGL